MTGFRGVFIESWQQPESYSLTEGNPSLCAHALWERLERLRLAAQDGSPDALRAYHRLAELPPVSFETLSEYHRLWSEGYQSLRDDQQDVLEKLQQVVPELQAAITNGMKDAQQALDRHIDNQQQRLASTAQTLASLLTRR